MAQAAAYGCEAAAFLQESLQSFDLEQLKAAIEAIHAIEHNADSVKHDMMKRLSAEFLAPIEREDILSLAQELDNVVDCLDDVMHRIYIHNVSALRGDIHDITAIIVRCTTALHMAVKELAQFKKSETIAQYIVDINSLESEGDGLYLAALRKLYTTESNAVSVISWTYIYDSLENCLDACEHASDIIESVIMKNS